MFLFFFFNDTATTEIYTLSLHDALPICYPRGLGIAFARSDSGDSARAKAMRSEEHTSELQSQSNLVCRLLLEKKKKKQTGQTPPSPCQQPLSATSTIATIRQNYASDTCT